MKIKNLLGELSGSMANITAAKNRYGFYLRQRTSPVQPRTPAQTARQEALAGFSDAWSNVLNDTQRESWEDLSNRVTYKDSQGTVYKLQANALYNKINLNLYTCSTVALGTAPLNQNVRPVASASIINATEGGDDIELGFSPAASATEKIVVKGVVNQNPGVSFVENQKRVIAVSDVSQASTWAVPLPEGSPGLILGSKIFLTVIRCDLETGAYSPGFSVIGIVTPAGP